jgi:hypothetical protein
MKPSDREKARERVKAFNRSQECKIFPAEVIDLHIESWNPGRLGVIVIIPIMQGSDLNPTIKSPDDSQHKWQGPLLLLGNPEKQRVAQLKCAGQPAIPQTGKCFTDINLFSSTTSSALCIPPGMYNLS